MGTYINYYFHCPRHLWLFARNIRMENTSEEVKIGKYISETTFSRKKHEVHIQDSDDYIVIDFINKSTKTIHEVKKSDKMKDLHIWQTKYYLYILDKNNVKGYKGIINYPKQMRICEVNLTEEDKEKIKSAISEIEKILQSKVPPSVINKPYCKKCSYYEFCYVE